MRRLIRDHPCLVAGLVAYSLLLLWGMLPQEVQDHPLGGAALATIAFPLRPFSAVATWVDPWLRRWPEWVDIAATGASGFLPYALADLFLRRLRHLARGRSIPPSPSGVGPSAGPPTD
jgi:hypothetical protein